jgi:hypothetical protein
MNIKYNVNYLLMVTLDSLGEVGDGDQICLGAGASYGPQMCLHTEASYRAPVIHIDMGAGWRWSLREGSLIIFTHTNSEFCPHLQKLVRCHLIDLWMLARVSQLISHG